MGRRSCRRRIPSPEADSERIVRGWALRYRLTQKIAERGDRESKVTFIVRKGNEEWETVELKVRYHGTFARTAKKE